MDAMNQTAQKRQHQRWMLAKLAADVIRDRMVITDDQRYEARKAMEVDQLASVIRITEAWGKNEKISAILCDVPASKSQRRLFHKTSLRKDPPMTALHNRHVVAWMHQQPAPRFAPMPVRRPLIAAPMPVDAMAQHLEYVDQHRASLPF